MSVPEPHKQTQTASARPDPETHPATRGYFFLSPPQTTNELGRLGNYRIIRLLGTGGMGYVFEAEELTLHRRVALKVLKPELASDLANRERFLREARATAAIRSEHVITIFEVEDGEPPFLTMEYLEGETLQARIERSPPITLRMALEIARQTAVGLAAAHEQGLVHRDIKPANLWLDQKPEPVGTVDELSDSSLRPPTSGFERVKVLDFGLARRTSGETSLTSTGFIVGTPNYMAPEQASGGRLDDRADLFSLGCVLYTVLTGELPFPGNSALAVMMSLATRIPPPVNHKNPIIPPEVARLVTQLLEKDANDRPQSAREVVRQLDEILTGFSGSGLLPISDPSLQPSRLDTPLARGETAFPGETDPYTRPSSAKKNPPPVPSRPQLCCMWAGIVVLLALAVVAGFRILRPGSGNRNVVLPGGDRTVEPIVVGILFSQSGTMAISESPLIDATILALEEVNANGGVLGRPVKWVSADGKSQPDVFAQASEHMLATEKVSAIFGCWTSSSRKAVRSVVQRSNGMLFYPVQFEGLEESPNIVYLGSTANQQLLPALDFLTKKLGKKRLLLIGSDYVFPRAAYQIMLDHTATQSNLQVSACFLPFGADEADEAITRIQSFQPDAIVNLLNGSINIDFCRELEKARIAPAQIPILSLSLTESEVRGLNPAVRAGDYLVGSYFNTINRPESKAFIPNIQNRFGEDMVVTAPMAAVYSGVHLWAQAANRAGSVDPNAVLNAVRGLEYEGPRARIKIDPRTRYTWLPVLIGRIGSDGKVTVLPDVSSESLVEPIPYPNTRTPRQWNQFLDELKYEWDGQWQAPVRSLINP